MENLSITVTDLDAVRSLLDLACTRGAFRASEAQQVGELYNKLSGFLDAVVAQAQQQEAEFASTQSQGE